MEAYYAFEDAEVIFGAERMLENLPGKGVKVPYYRADDIISYLIEHPQYTKVAAAFSGDSGFYSGAQSMKKSLDEKNIAFLFAQRYLKIRDNDFARDFICERTCSTFWCFME